MFKQVFLLLISEMALFMLLILPLPFTWRRTLFTFISESPIVAKIQYGMKVSEGKLEDTNDTHSVLACH